MTEKVTSTQDRGSWFERIICFLHIHEYCKWKLIDGACQYKECRCCGKIRMRLVLVERG
jgi:hypothetical protein